MLTSTSESTINGSKQTTVAAEKPTTNDVTINSETIVLQSTTATPTVKVVPPGAKTLNITKGFDLPSDKSASDGNENLKPDSNCATPRSQSPSSGRISPSGIEIENVENSDKKVTATKEFIKIPSRSRDSKLDVTAQYQQDRGNSKEQLHMVVIGHVDAGKSTLMGHLLFSMGQVNKKTMHKYEQESKKLGKQSFVYAWILDETGEESAVLYKVARKSVNQLGVVVNKLDTVGWSQERFEEIVGKLGVFLKQAGFRESEVSFVPCSGLTGENLTSSPTEDMLLQWYKGPCLLDVIDKFKSPERPITKPFRLSVNDIFKGTGSGFCVSGRVETGMVQVGDKVLVQPQNEGAVIKALSIDDAPVQVAFAGDQASATLSGIEMQNVSVGYILCDPAQPIPITSHFEARIVVFNIKLPITKGYSVVLHHQSLVEQAVITKLVAQLHKSSGEVVKKRPRCLVRNSNAVVELETSRPICMELYRDIKELGRYILI
ncbi:HBS1-like protein [Blattella germanica]|nr:HBS1-like protein [Blattella germanica]